MKHSLYIMPLATVLAVLTIGQAGVESIDDKPIVENPKVVVAEQVEITTDEKEKISLGLCKLTAYCSENYPHICNNGDATTTATGTTPTLGRTIAVDPSVIPYGSEVTIFGNTYVAEDCGGAVKGNHIDILFETHEEALEFGIIYENVSYIP